MKRLIAFLAAWLVFLPKLSFSFPLLIVALKHDHARLKSLEEVLYSISDPLSTEYGKWLSPETVATFTAAQPEIIVDAIAWVEAEAATCVISTTNAMSLSFSIVGQGDFIEIVGLSLECALHIAAHWKRTEFLEGAFVRHTAPPLHFVDGSSAMNEVHRFSGLAPVGPPNAQREAYGVPDDATARVSEALGGNLQMVWGPGTFGCELLLTLNPNLKSFAQHFLRSTNPYSLFHISIFSFRKQ